MPGAPGVCPRPAQPPALGAADLGILAAVRSGPRGRPVAAVALKPRLLAGPSIPAAGVYP